MIADIQRLPAARLAVNRLLFCGVDNHLLYGRYYGNITRRGQIADLILTETVYAPHACVPSHSHSNAYFCKILQGSYTETYERRSRQCDASTVAFHPFDETHSERFHASQVRSFNVEITPAYMERVRRYSDVFDQPLDFRGGMIVWLATKMYREFVENDNFSALTIEGLALEITALGSRRQERPTANQPGTWLRRAKEMLDSDFAGRLTLSKIADAVEVHPVHLTREFRKHYRRTIGEYVRQLRVEAACNEIRLGRSSLADIAAQAGFFDQSHFSRTFKALTGMTPGEYRAMHRGSRRGLERGS